MGNIVKLLKQRTLKENNGFLLTQSSNHQLSGYRRAQRIGQNFAISWRFWKICYKLTKDKATYSIDSPRCIAQKKICQLVRRVYSWSVLCWYDSHLSKENLRVWDLEQPKVYYLPYILPEQGGETKEVLGMINYIEGPN